MGGNYNRRQILSLLNQIELFEQHKLALGGLIGSLEFLLSNMEKEDSLLAFWKEWGRLEEYYSVCVVKKSGIIDLQHQEISESIFNLKALAHKWLSSYLKKIDYSVDQKAQAIEIEWLMCPKCNEAWKSNSTEAMVICPKCCQSLLNPRYKKNEDY